MNQPFVVRLALRLAKNLVNVENLVEGMLILFLGFLLVCLRKVLALLLKVLSVSAFVRLVPGSKLDKGVAD